MQNAKPNLKLKNTYLVLILIYLLILAIGSLPAIPLPNNQRLFVVSSGSMEPTLRTGSVVIAQPQIEYQAGEIITFTNPNKTSGEKQTITHRLERIINKNGEVVFMTKGDANVFSDDNFIPINQVIGKVSYRIFGLGYLVNFIKSKIGLVLLVFIPGLMIVGREITYIVTALRSYKKHA